MPRLTWSKRARGDAIALRQEQTAKNKAYAIRVSARIREVVAHLRRHPELGRAGVIPDTRELVVNGLPYAVVYAHDEANNEVVILAIVHTRGDWQ